MCAVVFQLVCCVLMCMVIVFIVLTTYCMFVFCSLRAMIFDLFKVCFVSLMLFCVFQYLLLLPDAFLFCLRIMYVVMDLRALFSSGDCIVHVFVRKRMQNVLRAATQHRCDMSTLRLTLVIILFTPVSPNIALLPVVGDPA